MTEATFLDMLACIDREARFRALVYPRWVKAGKLTGETAEVALDCMEGGTVQVTCVIQFYPEPAQVGFLASILGRDIKMSIIPAVDSEND